MFCRMLFRSCDVDIMLYFNDTATTETYTYCHTLSRRDALPIECAARIDFGSAAIRVKRIQALEKGCFVTLVQRVPKFFHRPLEAKKSDRKSTRLNSSH